LFNIKTILAIIDTYRHLYWATYLYKPMSSPTSPGLANEDPLRPGFEPPLYKPLDSPNAMRIVQLKRGSADKRIKCNLVHMDRADGSIPYEALSYEWGQPSNEDPFIAVDTHLVQIRKNLFDALQHIRLEAKDRYIWIDSLSIDQSNLKERGQQVKMMGSIYSSAEHVVVWLGLPRDESDMAMEWLADPTFVDDNYTGYSTWTPILALCSRPYWRRVWIQQEIYLAQRFTVHCGRRLVSHVQLCQKLKDLSGHDGIRRSPAYPLTRFYANRTPKMLREWLEAGIKSGLQTSEPRDFVYALLGISADCHDGKIVPDYEKPLHEIYRETVALCDSGAGWRVQNNRFRRDFAVRLGLGSSLREL
jgi:hypothetical protein